MTTDQTLTILVDHLNIAVEHLNRRFKPLQHRGLYVIVCYSDAGLDTDPLGCGAMPGEYLGHVLRAHLRGMDHPAFR